MRRRAKSIELGGIFSDLGSKERRMNDETGADIRICCEEGNGA